VSFEGPPLLQRRHVRKESCKSATADLRSTRSGRRLLALSLEGWRALFISVAEIPACGRLC